MQLKLVEKKTEVPNVHSFVLHPLEKLSWQAGQFLHYVLHHRPTDDRGSDRWFTVSSAPSENVVQITTRFTDEKGSSFKKRLQELRVGDMIEVANIEGDFVIKDETQEYVFLAGGIGITPFRSILKEFDDQGKKLSVTLIYANRDHDIVFKEELEHFAKKNSQLQIHYVFSPAHIDEAKIKELVRDLQKPLFYVSGPGPMVDAMVGVLKKMSVPEKHIKQDWFPGYPAD